MLDFLAVIFPSLINALIDVTQSSGITWTNRSVLALTGDEDPVRAITTAARNLVIKAYEKGWEGPPFNPLEIVKMMNVQIGWNSEIEDARLIHTDAGTKIEFNPRQPRERVRFSIAHEVAHMLFPDWTQEIRNRGGQEDSNDDWQLEMLCNIAASELVMPMGSLVPLEPIPPIETLMQKRREFDVSAEAFLIRLAKISTYPIGMFVASPRTGESQQRQYNVNYFISSPTAPHTNIAGIVIPRDSAVYQCTAIGYTDCGTEKWVTGNDTKIECVGIPAYPGSIYPRVAAVVRFEMVREGRQPIKYVHGDVLSPRGEGKKIICQLVNDRAVRWGGGVARKAAKRFPHAEKSFSLSIDQIPRSERLGKAIFSNAEEGITIASLIAQEGYGPSVAPRIRYHSLEKCMYEVAERADWDKATIHIPRIGTGVSRGNWETIEEMLDDVMVRSGLSVTVYDLPPRRMQTELF